MLNWQRSCGNIEVDGFKEYFYEYEEFFSNSVTAGNRFENSQHFETSMSNESYGFNNEDKLQIALENEYC